MKQKDKELLLKDLCGRLPYEVKLFSKFVDGLDTKEVVGRISQIDDSMVVGILNETNDEYSFTYVAIHEAKPYLFPLSSITKEHRKEISEILKDININHPPYGLVNPNGCDALLTTVTMQGAALIEFYNKYHYDYNNLIPKGLAIDATGLNIY